MEGKQKKIKIAFVHSKCKQFRVETFEALQEIYDVDFYFTDSVVSTLRNKTELRSIKIPFMSDFHYVPELRKELEKKEYDIYVSTDLGYHITYITYSIAKKKGKKFILWNEQWKNILHPRRLLITYLLENRILRNSDAILAFGKKAIDFSIARGGNKKKIIHTPNIVPKLEIRLKKEPKNTSNNKTILCIARLIPFKGQDFLIKAFKKVTEDRNDVKLIVAGEGPRYNKLRSLIKELGLEDSVELTGEIVKNDQKWDLLNECDIFVLPSVYRRTPEAWGLVVNEAAMMEKPIITTNMTGVDGEVVRHKVSGLIVKEKDIEELANSITSLLNNPELAQEYATRAKEIVEKEYNLEKVLNSFDKAVNTALFNE